LTSSKPAFDFCAFAVALYLALLLPERRLDARDQHFIVKRFLQKIDRTHFHRFYG
jgi:hypothetical protein